MYSFNDPPSEQLHNLSIIKSDSGPSGESWMTEHSTEVVIASMLLLFSIGVVAFVQIIRNSELE